MFWNEDGQLHGCGSIAVPVTGIGYGSLFCLRVGIGLAMAQSMNSESVLLKNIESKIYLIRGEKVMLDEDLATLYGVPTMRLNEQVKRNIRRFPIDFMFQLENHEFSTLISQIAISKP